MTLDVAAAIACKLRGFHYNGTGEMYRKGCDDCGMKPQYVRVMADIVFNPKKMETIWHIS